MSDGVTPVQPEVSGDIDRSRLLTAGGMLRSAREAAGLHIAALAVAMKVPVKKLEALESDRLDLLPDVVFVRALASSVCRTLKIDPGPVLEKLPRTNVPQLGAGERLINTPFHAHGKPASLSVPSFFAKPSVLLVLALLIGTCAVFFFPVLQKHEPALEVVTLPGKIPSEGAQSSASVPQDDAVPLATPINVPEVVATAPVLPTSEASVSSSPSAVPALDSAAGQAGAKSVAVAPLPASAPRDVLAASGSASELLALKARAPSWVKVIDAKGTVQLSKTLAAGEAVNVGGTAPLSVVIGAADALDVEVRGKPFSLLGIAKENVARFEVK